MITLQYPLVLASSSPRRQELLRRLNIPFTIDVSDINEDVSGPPEEVVRLLSEKKTWIVAKRHPNSIILGADTLVFKEHILGKPHNIQEAYEMLSSLSGTSHEVFTGITLINTATTKTITHVEHTRVYFSFLTPEEIQYYLSLGESFDKAGGYAIQGFGEAFIKKIDGSYSNVVGLPLNALRLMLKEI